MELTPGYKQTELGVIPMDWEARAVSELSQIKTGPFGTLLKASEYSDREGVPIISVGEIGAGSFKVTEHTPLASKSVVRRLPQFVLRSGDIVFGRKGAVERSALVTEAEDGWFLGSDGIAIRPRDGCHSPYLAAQFQSHEVKSWLLQNAIGTTMASLNQAILGRVQVPIAPLPEQCAIAATLSDVDALLGGLERLIAKKRDLKEAAMQQLLTCLTRLPGFHGKWEVKRLGDVGSTYGGLTGKAKADFGSGEGRYITFMNVMSNVKIDTQSFDYVRVAPGESQNRVMCGDLLFNGSSETPEEVAMCSILTEDVPELYLNSFCFGFRIRPGAVADGLFLTYLLRSNVGREVMKSLAQGSTRYNLSKGALLKAAIQLPSSNEQAAIAAVVSDIDTELSALIARRDKTRALKQAMMQELLTGKTRLV